MSQLRMTRQQKKYKNTKFLKDEDMAETWAIESRPWEVSKNTSPAALMSTHHPTLSAAEVSNRMITNLPIPITPNYTRNQYSCGDEGTPSTILCWETGDFDNSISLESWPVAADFSETSAAVSTEESVLE